MRRMVCTVAAALLLSGCLLEGAGPLRNLKPYGAQWVKEGVTKEEWLADWVQCGGGGDGNYGYEGKGQSHKEFVESYLSHADRVDACMKGKGYVHLNQCDARCF